MIMSKKMVHLAPVPVIQTLQSWQLQRMPFNPNFQRHRRDIMLILSFPIFLDLHVFLDLDLHVDLDQMQDLVQLLIVVIVAAGLQHQILEIVAVLKLDTGANNKRTHRIRE